MRPETVIVQWKGTHPPRAALLGDRWEDDDGRLWTLLDDAELGLRVWRDAYGRIRDHK